MGYRASCSLSRPGHRLARWVEPAFLRNTRVKTLLPEAVMGQVGWYGKKWSRRRESNSQPTVYKTVALPLSYSGPAGSAI